MQDLRLGGLLQRMKSCLSRLEDYRDGKVSSIPELEEELLPYAVPIPGVNEWAYCTVNVLA